MSTKPPPPSSSSAIKKQNISFSNARVTTNQFQYTKSPYSSGGSGGGFTPKGTLAPEKPKPKGTIFTFKEVEVHEIIFPPSETKSNKSFFIFSDKSMRKFKGEVPQLRTQHWFLHLEFQAAEQITQYDTTYVIDSSSLKYHPRPLTVGLLVMIMNDSTKSQRGSELREVVCKQLEKIIQDNSVRPESILADPESYVAVGVLTDDTKINPKGLEYSPYFWGALCHHPYFSTSAVKRMLYRWIGSIMPYHTKGEISFLRRTLAHEPWGCFFDGLLPAGITPLNVEDIGELQTTLGVTLSDVQQSGIKAYHKIREYQEKNEMVTVPLNELKAIGVTDSMIDWLCDIGVVRRVRITDPKSKLYMMDAIQDVRRFCAEEIVAERIKSLMSSSNYGWQKDAVEAIENYLIQRQPLGLEKDQMIAIMKILEYFFTLLTGGPGMGKTHTHVVLGHLASEFLGDETLILTVSGKAHNDVIKKYRNMLPDIDKLCKQMVLEQGDSGQGPLRFAKKLDPRDLTYWTPTSSSVGASFVEYSDKIANEKTDGKPPGYTQYRHPSQSGKSEGDSTYWKDEEEATKDWVRAMKSSACFYPLEEDWKNRTSPELVSWAKSINSPLTPSTLIDAINERLDEQGTSLDKLCGYRNGTDDIYEGDDEDEDAPPKPAPSSRPLKFRGYDTKLYKKPVFPPWVLEQWNKAFKMDLNKALEEAGYVDDNEDGDDDTGRGRGGSDDDDEEVVVNIKPKISDNIPPRGGKPKPKIRACTMAEFTYRFRMAKELGIDNPYLTTTRILFDEQLCSIVDMAEVFIAAPYLRSITLIGDKDQLGSIETGSLFPVLIQMHQRAGLLVPNPNLEQLFRGQILARLCINHRFKSKEETKGKKRELTDIAQALNCVLRNEVPKPSKDVELVYYDQNPYPFDPRDFVDDKSKEEVRDKVFSLVKAYDAKHGDAKYMIPYKDEVDRLNQILYCQRFGTRPEDGMPLRVGMDVRITTKALCWGNQLFTNGDTGRITHIAVSGKKLKGVPKHKSGYGGEPRELIPLKENQILLNKDFPGAMVLIDGYRLAELSRFEISSFVPGKVSTVHSAQGRESEREVLVLADHPLRLRRLTHNKVVYTGLSRASKFGCIISYCHGVLEKAIERRAKDEIVTRLPDILGFKREYFEGYPEAYKRLCRMLGLTDRPEILQLPETSPPPSYTEYPSAKPSRPVLMDEEEEEIGATEPVLAVAPKPAPPQTPVKSALSSLKRPASGSLLGQPRKILKSQPVVIKVEPDEDEE